MRRAQERYPSPVHFKEEERAPVSRPPSRLALKAATSASRPVTVTRPEVKPARPEAVTHPAAEPAHPETVARPEAHPGPSSPPVQPAAATPYYAVLAERAPLEAPGRSMVPSAIRVSLRNSLYDPMIKQGG
jgi:hypothetical protein